MSPPKRLVETGSIVGVWRILYELPKLGRRDRIFQTECVDCGHTGSHLLGHLDRRCRCNRIGATGRKPFRAEQFVDSIGAVPDVFALGDAALETEQRKGPIVKAIHTPGLRIAGRGERGAWEVVERPDTRADGHPRTLRKFFWLVCPGECGTLSALAIDGKGPPNRNWTWDDNTEAPTLTPSINHVGCWHGHLIKGEFVSC